MRAPITTLLQFMSDKGLFDAWTSETYGEQDKPVVQSRRMQEEIIPSNQRAIVVKSVSAGSGDRYVTTPVFLIAVLSKVGEAPAVTEEFAYRIYDAMLDFDTFDCIISLEPLGSVNGAYPMESGRLAYDMEFSAKVDNGRVQY